MSNLKTLIPANKRSKEERTELARRAGIASGVAKRKKKQQQEEERKIASIMAQLLELPLKNLKDKNGNPRPLEEINGAESLQDLSSKNVRTKVALGLALIKEGLEGNLKATEMALRMAGEETNSTKEINITGGLPVIISGEDSLED